MKYNSVIFAVKFLFVFCLILFVLVSIIPTVSAQENPDQAAKKYGITFPIGELGNCSSFAACKSYCDNAANKDTCVSFAKKKGFYKEPQQGQNTEIVQAAKTQLGCDSETSCRAFCEKPENSDKCQTFAKQHNLGSGSQRNPRDKQVLQKAKEILGCDSENSCKAICQNEVNHEKCSTFAKETGLGGGIRQVGPGGCNSEESCRAYCATHQDECRQFGGGQKDGQNGNRQGPGGCNSEESCRAYCTTHQEECKQFGGGQGNRNQNDRQGGPGGCNSPEACKKYCEDHPAECKGQIGQTVDQNRPKPGGCNSEESCKKFCEEHPNDCKNGNGQGPQGNNMNDTFCKEHPEQCQRPENSEEFCKKNPDKCRRPADAGGRIPPVSGTQQQFQPQNQGRPGANEQPKPGTGQDNFQQQQGQPQQPNTQPQEQSVQGATTEKTLFEKILNFFRF